MYIERRICTPYCLYWIFKVFFINFPLCRLLFFLHFRLWKITEQFYSTTQHYTRIYPYGMNGYFTCKSLFTGTHAYFVIKLQNTFVFTAIYHSFTMNMTWTYSEEQSFNFCSSINIAQKLFLQVTRIWISSVIFYIQ